MTYFFDRRGRNREFYAFLFIVTILLGLLSRSELIPLPTFISTYAGDTLWALMVFWGFCFFFHKAHTLQIALFALLFAFAIEFSQLYHAEWIDTIREMKLGGLILGFGFKASDLICYTVGVSIGAFLDYIFQNNGGL